MESKMEALILPWFFFWLGGAVIVGVIANQRRNRSGIGWFFLSLLISPLLAGLLVLALLPYEGVIYQKSRVHQFLIGRSPFSSDEPPTLEQRCRDLWVAVVAMAVFLTGFFLVFFGSCNRSECNRR
jgi:hypothetical protein